MKRLVVILTVLVLSLILTQSVFAQATANMSVTLAVNTVYKITATATVPNLTISDGTAGVDALTSAVDASTKYSITQNFGNTVKITGYLSSAMPAGYTLTMNLASVKGTSAGTVDVSNATSGSAVNLVTAINRGADANQTITYTFATTASAGTLASTARTVTLTLTN
ncbi:MAG: hypothetical protein ABSB78_00275 [Bacteroidota bacterium]